MHPVEIVTTSILLAASAYADNPFLDAKDDRPVFAKFRGTEWGDNIDEGEIALMARLITTRIAKMLWGARHQKSHEFAATRRSTPKCRPKLRHVCNFYLIYR
jgi:hypothetical protein